MDDVKTFRKKKGAFALQCALQYTPKIGFEIAASGREREQSRSSKEARKPRSVY